MSISYRILSVSAGLAAGCLGVVPSYPGSNPTCTRASNNWGLEQPYSAVQKSDAHLLVKVADDLLFPMVIRKLC